MVSDPDLGPCLAVVELNKSGTGLELMRRALDRGVPVVLAVKDPGYYRSIPWQDPGLTVVRCNSEDPRALVSELRPFAPTAVVAPGDHYVRQAAVVACALRARGLGEVVAQLGRHKARITERLASVVDVPWSVQVDRSGTIPELPSMPVVVKPTDGTGSEFVYFCASCDEVRTAVEVITSLQTNHRGQRRDGSALVSEFVPGPEFSAEVLVSNGQSVVAGITVKQLYSSEQFIETGHTFPLGDAELAEQLGDYATRVVAGLEIDSGAMHIELRAGPRGPRLIEVNFRAAGDGITGMIERATGVSFIDGWLDCALGKQPHRSWPALCEVTAVYDSPAATCDISQGNGVRGARREFVTPLGQSGERGE